MELAVQQIINALSLGSIYALVALGVAIVFSILRLANFAHGELVTVAGYTLYPHARRQPWFFAFPAGGRSRRCSPRSSSSAWPTGGCAGRSR